jgi:hypothetical protein
MTFFFCSFFFSDSKYSSNLNEIDKSEQKSLLDKNYSWIKDEGDSNSGK